jgi:hypothetical protein
MLLYLLACTPTPTVEPFDFEPTFTNVQEQIFDKNCASSSCHGEGRGSKNLTLHAGDAYRDLVDVPSEEVPEILRVARGDPDSSYLVMKIRGDEGIDDDVMPPGNPMDDARVQLVVDWVAGGASPN